VPEAHLVTRREWVYPSDVRGRYRRARRAFGWLLVAFFVGMPWVTVGGLPAVRFDIPGRRVLLLGTVFTPHDNWALALIGIAASLALFLFTSVLGRVWCGWACPQTVWLEWVYRPLERWIEGPSNRRRKRDEGPRGLGYFGVKGLKWLAFAGLTAATTFVFFSWFNDPRALVTRGMGPVGWTLAALLFTAFYLDAAWFREQMCHYVCPYARFQGALMDDHSLVVAYDALRGEPRKRGKEREGGDCVSCDRCVSVCPSGVDIRDGDQLQCIACAACADACDEVMVKIGRPRGLIRYTDDRDSLRRGARPTWIHRRTVAYLGLLAGVLALLVVGLAGRSEVAANATRTPGAQMYQVLPDGRIANQFAVHISNRSPRDHTFTLATGEGTGTTVTAPGTPWTVAWGDELRMPAFVVAPREGFRGGRYPTEIEVVRDDGVTFELPVTLLGPGDGGRES